MNVKIKPLVESIAANNWWPTYATKGAACFDIHAIEEGLVGAIPKIFRTGLAFEIPEGNAMLVFSRSGYGFSKDIRLSNCVGVIDSDYRGELKIKLVADGVHINRFMPGDRIAQAMIVPVPQVSFIVGELSDTERGEGGFGSSGS